jgi:tetratricopeptide (TPR) repeat protein
MENNNIYSKGEVLQMNIENMAFDQIMARITSGLTGSPEENIQYLMDQGEIYKTNKYSKEILRAIGRILYDIAPKDMRDKFDRAVNNDNLGIEKTMEEVDFQIYRNNYNKAFEIIKTLINKLDELEETGWLMDDDISEYYCFNNTLEEIVYKEMFKPAKEVRQKPAHYAYAYLKYGIILFELKRYDDAAMALKKANKNNPVCTNILFELSEISKINKRWDEYLTINNKCLEYAYSSKALARCYRNYGFYFIEQHNYTAAIALFFLSLSFDQESKMAQSELLYIMQKTGKAIKPPAPNEIIELLKKYNIPLGANKLILGVAFAIAKEAQNHKDYSAAKFFYEIYYDLTGDKEVKNIIETIKTVNMV